MVIMSRQYVVARDVNGVRSYWCDDERYPWTFVLGEAKRFDAADIERGPEMKDPGAFWLPLRPKGSLPKWMLFETHLHNIAIVEEERDAARAEVKRCNQRFADGYDVYRDRIREEQREEDAKVCDADAYHSASSCARTIRAGRPVASDPRDARIAELEVERSEFAYRVASTYVSNIEHADAIANARRAAIETCIEICEVQSDEDDAGGYALACAEDMRALLTEPTADDGRGEPEPGSGAWGESLARAFYPKEKP